MHDLSFIDRRAHEAEFYMALALIGVAAGLGLLATAIVLALLRGWNRSLRQAIDKFQSWSRRLWTATGRKCRSGGISRRCCPSSDSSEKYADSIHVEWSPNTLHQLLDQELPGAQVIVLSNREPYIHNLIDGRVGLQTPASGLVSALEPVMRATGGAWVAHGSGSADRETVDGRDGVPVPPDNPAYRCDGCGSATRSRTAIITGFANEGLWPLCHIAFVRPTFRERDWKHYVRSISASPTPWSRRRTATTRRAGAGLSLRPAAAHAPPAPAPRDDRRVLAYPVAESGNLRHVPLAGADHRRAARQLDPRLPHAVPLQQLHRGGGPFRGEPHRPRGSSVTLGGRETLVRPYPISIEWPPEALARPGAGRGVPPAVRETRARPDTGSPWASSASTTPRASSTACARSTSSWRPIPEWRGKFALIQVAAPTRSKLTSYRGLQADAVDLAEEINARTGGRTYKPIRFGPPPRAAEVFELFRAADLCVVSSLHDGMNLVAKEFVAARDDEQGVLVLSSFAGARANCQALIVNPYNPAEWPTPSTRRCGWTSAARADAADAGTCPAPQRLPLGRPDAARRGAHAPARAHRGRGGGLSRAIDERCRINRKDAQAVSNPCASR